MTYLSEISIDKIETDIMSVLYANLDTKFTQYSLFDKLIKDKYDYKLTDSIHPNFKSKFLLVLRNLMSKYDDIKITKERTIYNVICFSDPNPETIGLIKSYDNPDNLKIEQINKSPLKKADLSNMFDYIYDNNLTEHINWSEPFDGNSIYHELVLNNCVRQITKLIENNTFDFTVLNNQNQVPTDLIDNDNIGLFKIMSNGLIKNIININEKLNTEKNNVKLLLDNYTDKIIFYESEQYKNMVINNTYFTDVIWTKTKKYYFGAKLYLFSFIICYLAMRIIF